MVLEDKCIVPMQERDTVRQCGLPEKALIHQSKFGHTFIDDTPLHIPIPEGDGRVFAYSPVDEELFVYNFPDDRLYEAVKTFHLDIWFYLTDEEIREHVSENHKVTNNLKSDYVWFRPGINQLHIIQCTCGEFLEADKSMDKLAKLAVNHFERTGHTLNPRGN